MKDDDFILLRVLVTDRLSNRQTFVNVELLSRLKRMLMRRKAPRERYLFVCGFIRSSYGLIMVYIAIKCQHLQQRSRQLETTNSKTKETFLYIQSPIWFSFDDIFKVFISESCIR